MCGARLGREWLGVYRLEECSLGQWVEAGVGGGEGVEGVNDVAG